MNYNPERHHRRSIRLKGYDYSQAGLYFITICTQSRLHLFGKIENDKMMLNDAGIVINQWWNELKCKFHHIELHEQITMPNHFHGIIEITNPPIGEKRCVPVGADLSVCPSTSNPKNTNNSKKTSNPKNTNDSRKTSNPRNVGNPKNIGGHVGEGGHVGPPLHEMMQWFKTMTTNAYIRGVKQNNWQRFNKKLWQRNYYEHIIRDEKAYLHISDYIKTNPSKWQDDTYYESDHVV